MKKTLLIAASVVVAGMAAAHWYFSDRGRLTTEPEYTGLARTVSGNDLISKRDPAAVLRFDPADRYIGGQKLILYGVADTEQHLFVETTSDDSSRASTGYSTRPTCRASPVPTTTRIRLAAHARRPRVLHRYGSLLV